MVGLRPGRCYRDLERSYTRKSKYKKKAFIRSVPTCKIIKFVYGDKKKDFKNEVSLTAKKGMQVRQNSLESVRVLVNRRLQRTIGKNYKLHIRVYPHHVLRENKMLTGAGADRMQTGMQRAFGKAVGLAAQVKRGQAVMTIYCDDADVQKVMPLLKLANHRLSGSYIIKHEKK